MQVAKDDRIGGESLCGRGLDAILLQVIAQGTLGSQAGIVVPFQHTKWARRHAITTPITDIRLDVNIPKLIADDRLCWTGLHAACVGTVFAHVAHHQPVYRFACSICRPGMLNESDVPPGRGGKGSRIVITMACKRVAICRQLVPLFAGDLASLTAYAVRAIREKSHVSNKGSPSSPLRHFTPYNTAILSLVRATPWTHISGKCFGFVHSA